MNIPRNPIAGPRLLQRSAIVLALAVVATAAHVPAAAQTAAASTASTPKPASRSQPTFESPQAGFERRLERMVEGTFARIFRSGIRPVALGFRKQEMMRAWQQELRSDVYIQVMD